jgi:hypothetical protein
MAAINLQQAQICKIVFGELMYPRSTAHFFQEETIRRFGSFGEVTLTGYEEKL